MRTLRWGLPALSLALLFVDGRHVVKADTVTETISFAATDLFTPPIPGLSSTPPFPAIAGSVTLTFDPTQAVVDSTQGLTVNNLTPSTLSDGPVGYTVDPNYDELFLGGVLNAVNQVDSNTDDFYVVIDNIATATPTFSNAVYSPGGF